MGADELLVEDEDGVAWASSPSMMQCWQGGTSDGCCANVPVAEAKLLADQVISVESARDQTRHDGDDKAPD